jgi:hypothetical protein
MHTSQQRGEIFSVGTVSQEVQILALRRRHFVRSFGNGALYNRSPPQIALRLRGATARQIHRVCRLSTPNQLLRGQQKGAVISI